MLSSEHRWSFPTADLFYNFHVRDLGTGLYTQVVSLTVRICFVLSCSDGNVCIYPSEGLWSRSLYTGGLLHSEDLVRFEL